MKVYFVRHGESKFNAIRHHQHGRVELSPLGIKQAEIVAKRFKKIPIDIILASHFARAKKTAEIINETLHKPIIFDETLREFKRPTEIEGLSFDNPVSIKIRKQIKDHFAEPTWHYSDEENFFDLQARASSFLEHLNTRTEQNILVVSHEFTIQWIILSMMFGKDIKPEVYAHFHEFFRSKNTGITVCEKLDTGKWHLLGWNDHAHLD